MKVSTKVGGYLYLSREQQQEEVTLVSLFLVDATTDTGVYVHPEKRRKKEIQQEHGYMRAIFCVSYTCKKRQKG